MSVVAEEVMAHGVAGHTALVEPNGQSLSYHALGSIVRSLAAELASVAGSVTAMALPNSLECIVTFLAVTCVSTAAPLNPQYSVEEMKFYISDSNASVLIVDDQGNKSAQEAAKSLGIKVVTIRRTKEGNFLFEGLKRSVSMKLKKPDDTALLLHTSGTTSRPKLVPLTHSNLIASIKNIQATYELSPSDVGLLVMPLFHVHGLMCGLLSALFAGGTVVVHGKFAASRFWNDVLMFQANWYTAVPTIHQILLQRYSQDYPHWNPPKLRFIRSCSSSLAPALMEQLEIRFQAPVIEAYAMTEAAHQMTSNMLPKNGKRKPGSVGKPNVELAILDDTGNILPAGKIGEVCIRGPNVTKGYLKNPVANKDAFAYNWFHTGDQGYLDSEGFLFLTGRLKEIINRGGEKISPLEIDSVLLSHPAVAEAVSFGVPDAKYGQVVGVVVTLSPKRQVSRDELMLYCSKKLAPFKVPESSHFFIAESIPKTGSGKIQRIKVGQHFTSIQSSKSRL